MRGDKNKIMLKISKGKIYCFDPHFSKYMLMGRVIGDTLFKVVEAKHYMRVVDGYGFQYNTFSELPREGITKIHITERHTNNSWDSDYKDWQEHCHIADYGRGKQIFLSLKYMKRVDREKLKEKSVVKELERAKTINQSNIF